ncbi:MAG TPA: TonB-dependent receptor [Rhizomicrobium sp.]|nr:TonB-dependent receptor [Rhizomicrobium sp.]
MKSVLYTSAALIALATPALAQSQLSYPHLDDENVVVSATRLPTPTAEIASSVTVITAAQIEARQDRSLPDVLRTVPGLNIVQTGGAGGQTSIFMRGTNANHTKVLLDGIDIGDPSTPSGAPDISKLLAGDIARVEVLRGPQGALYGSDAIGGVINILTRSGEGPMKISADAEGGSFDTFNQRASASGSEGAFHYAATVQHFHSGDTPVTPLNLLPPGQRRNDDFYDNFTGTAKLGYDVTPNFDLGLVSRVTNSLGKFTGDAFNFVTFASFPSPTRTRISSIQYQSRGTAHLVLWDGRFDQTLGLAYGHTIAATQDPDNGDSRAIGDRIKLDWQGNIAVTQGETLVLGAETARDALHPGLSFGFPSTLSRGVTTNAGYAELQSDFGWGLYNSASIRYNDNSRFGNKTTWRVAPAWVIEETGTKLKASVGTGFKAPALQQLFGTFGGNANLKPETSFGYDVGVEQKLLGDTLTGGVTWFQNNIKNLITSGPAPAFLNINVGRARTDGVESFIAWKALDVLTLRADYTYTDAIDAGTKLALLRRPRHKASLNASWQALDDLTLDVTLLYMGPQIDGNRDFSIPRLKMPDVTTLDLAASYRLTEKWSLFGRIENAFDTRYQSPDGFERPGIGAYGGIKVNL